MSLSPPARVTLDVVDLFAGPGGWSVACQRRGLTELGIENVDTTCDTRRAAGHLTLQADVQDVDPRDYLGVPGLLASPPCQTFSKAGKGTGRRQLDLVQRAVKHVGAGEWPTDLIAETTDPRTALVLQPLRWALIMQPEWLAWEQVPSVLPAWEAMAEVLRQHGYSVVTGCVQAEQFGVPQTRRRAVLLASRTREVALPVPTHSRYHSRAPERLDPGVLSWVSMADALSPHSHGDVTLQTPAMLRAKDYTIPRTLDRPANTLACGNDASQLRWVPTFVSQSGTPVDEQWPSKRPSTTVAGRDLVQNPGATANRFNGSTKSRNDGVRVTVAEASVLQTFPADYPWQGSRTAHWTQVGDAVPPLLADALLQAVTS